MSQIVKLRRSSVSGQKPTNSNLQLGELALNTTDGKVYMAKSGSLGPSVEELITTNTVNTGSLSITGAITGSIFTGSFKGDGSELYNIPASGVTGLQLNKIVDGAYSASISSTRGFEVNAGSTFNNQMLIRTSGSINSLNIIGNHESYTQLEVKNTNSGSSASGDIVVTSNSGDDSVHYIDMGINSSTYDAGYVGRANDSYLLNSGEDLYIGTIGGGTHSSDLHLFTQNNWENPQIHISGSKQIGFNTSSVSNGFQYEFSGSIKGKNNLTIVGSVSSSMFTGSFKGDGSQLYNLPYSGLTNVPTLVSGSSQISYTGITDVPLGIVSGSSQIIDLGFTTTSSFNSFASGALLSSQTSSMTVLSSSYAVTASYALNGGGGGTEGRTAKLVQSVVSDTWTFAHNLGEKYPSVEIFDENDYVIIPTNILAVDENNLTITFSHEITGVATATVGGGLPYISGSYNGRVLAVGAGNPVWKEGIISGSLQVSNFGFAITGSNSFKDNQIITGSVTIRNAKMDATCVTLTSNATIFNLGSYDGAIFDYVVKNGGNMRAGTITGVWNGATSNYNETSTVDMGTTSNINFNVTGTGLLNAVITGGTWQVEVFYRALGCSS